MVFSAYICTSKHCLGASPDGLIFCLFSYVPKRLCVPFTHYTGLSCALDYIRGPILTLLMLQVGGCYVIIALAQTFCRPRLALH